MNSEFKDYYKKLVKIGKLKTAIFSIIIGFCANFVAAFITVFLDINVWAALGISLGTGVAAGIISAFPLYYLKFKPTTKTMAAILDKHGLEERIITMVELENDNSDMAKLQRENAINILRKANLSLKFAVPLILVVLLAVSATIGLSMTTVTTLAAADIIHIGGGETQTDDPDNPADPDDEDGEEETNVSILYEAGPGGKLMDKDGNLRTSVFQELKKGSDAATVIAVPDEGYEFCNWTDGNPSAERRDRGVTVSFSVQAVFRETEVPGEGEEGDGDGEGDQGGDEGGQSGGDGNGGQSGEGDGHGNGDGNGGQTGPGGGGGGAGYDDVHDNNNVVDGNTDYHEEIDYQALKEQIENDDSLTQEEKDMLLSYLKLLMGDGSEE